MLRCRCRVSKYLIRSTGHAHDQESFDVFTTHNKRDLKMQNKPAKAQTVAVDDVDEPDDW